MQEARQDGTALKRMRDLGMELHAIEFAALVRHRGDRASGIVGDDFEARRQTGDLIAVTHPHVEQSMSFGVAAVLNVAEERRVAASAHLGIAELAHDTHLHLAAQLFGHRLHAIADAQYGYTELEHGLRRMRRAARIGRRMPAGQNHAFRSEAANETVAHIPGMDLAIDFALTHTARDQLRVLRAEIENQNLVVSRRLYGAGWSSQRLHRVTLHSSPFIRFIPLDSWVLPSRFERHERATPARRP